MTHAWSLDPAGQAAIRRAEDGRTDAVPTLDELFAAVPWRMPKSVSGSSAAEPENKGDTMRADGLRTERVTLEITHSASDDSLPVRHWDWAKILTDGKALYPRESVRVVEEDDVDSPLEPRGWLTAEEREAVEWFCGSQKAISTEQCDRWKDALCGLLARSTPPRVKVPVCPDPKEGYYGVAVGRDNRWIAAIREAGVEVAE